MPPPLPQCAWRVGGNPGGVQDVTEKLSYPEAPEALIALWQERRAPLGVNPGEGLPPLDADLAHLAGQRAAPPPQGPSGHARKQREVAADLPDASQLAVLHGLVIAHLRKRDYPAHAPALFRRIWAEQGAHLLAELPPRWLISAMTTFGDHGATEGQRALGREMTMLLSLIKLYEYERQFSGTPPEVPFRLRDRIPAPLPLGMPAFSLVQGGLDVNLLAPLWARAAQEPVAGPLACHLLDRLNADPCNLFRRVTLMREIKARRRKAAE